MKVVTEIMGNFCSLRLSQLASIKLTAQMSEIYHVSENSVSQLRRD